MFHFVHNNGPCSNLVETQFELPKRGEVLQLVWYSLQLIFAEDDFLQVSHVTHVKGDLLDVVATQIQLSNECEIRNLGQECVSQFLSVLIFGKVDSVRVILKCQTEFVHDGHVWIIYRHRGGGGGNARMIEIG